MFLGESSLEFKSFCSLIKFARFSRVLSPLMGVTVNIIFFMLFFWGFVLFHGVPSQLLMGIAQNINFESTVASSLL